MDLVLWLSLYLNQQFGFNVKEIGAFAWIPYVGEAGRDGGGGLFMKNLPQIMPEKL